MISKENESMQEAAQTLYTMHCDETIRDMARARQEQIAWETSMQKMLAERNDEIAAKDDEIAALKAEIAKLKSNM